MSKKLTTFTHLTSACNAVKTYILGIIGQLAKTTADSIEEIESKNTEQDTAIEKNADDITELNGDNALHGRINGSLKDNVISYGACGATGALNTYPYYVLLCEATDAAFSGDFFISGAGAVQFDAILSVYSRTSNDLHAAHVYSFRAFQESYLKITYLENKVKIWYVVNSASQTTNVSIIPLRTGHFQIEKNNVEYYTTANFYATLPDGENEMGINFIDLNGSGLYMPLSGGALTGSLTLPYIEIPTTGQQLPALRIGDNTHGYLTFDNDEVFSVNSNNELLGIGFNNPTSGKKYIRFGQTKDGSGGVVLYSDEETSSFTPSTTLKNKCELGVNTNRWKTIYVDNIVCTNPPWENSGADLSIVSSAAAVKSFALTANSQSNTVSCYFKYTKINDTFVATALTLSTRQPFTLKKDTTLASNTMVLESDSVDAELYNALKQKYFDPGNSPTAVISVPTLFDAAVKVFIDVKKQHDDLGDYFELTLYIANMGTTDQSLFYLDHTFSF